MFPILGLLFTCLLALDVYIVFEGVRAFARKVRWWIVGSTLFVLFTVAGILWKCRLGDCQILPSFLFFGSFLLPLVRLLLWWKARWEGPWIYATLLLIAAIPCALVLGSFLTILISKTK